MAFKYREELVGKRFLCVSCGSNKLKLSKIAEWDWRSGIIRAASHKDHANKDLTVLVEFDDCEWQRRDWVRVHKQSFRLFLVEHTLVWALRKDKGIYWPALNFKVVVDEAGLGECKPVEFLVERKRHYLDYAELKVYQESDWESQPSSREFPEVRSAVKRWLEFQDGQRILLTTPSVLVGYRLKVYRSEGTTQWYTAVIVSYNENSKELTLTDDTVLEAHNEDPALVQMKLIGDGVVESILKGENVGITPRRRACTNHVAGQYGSRTRASSNSGRLSPVPQPAPAGGPSPVTKASVQPANTTAEKSKRHNSARLQVTEVNTDNCLTQAVENIPTATTAPSEVRSSSEGGEEPVVDSKTGSAEVPENEQLVNGSASHPAPGDAVWPQDKVKQASTHQQIKQLPSEDENPVPAVPAPPSPLKPPSPPAASTPQTPPTMHPAGLSYPPPRLPTSSTGARAPMPPSSSSGPLAGLYAGPPPMMAAGLELPYPRHLPLIPPNYGAGAPNAVEVLWQQQQQQQQKFSHLASPHLPPGQHWMSPATAVAAAAQFEMRAAQDRHNMIQREKREEQEREREQQEKKEREQREHKEREQKQARERAERERAQREAVQQHFEESLRLARQKGMTAGWSPISNLPLTSKSGSVPVSSGPVVSRSGNYEAERERHIMKTEQEARERFYGMESQAQERWLTLVQQQQQQQQQQQRQDGSPMAQGFPKSESRPGSVGSGTKVKVEYPVAHHQQQQQQQSKEGVPLGGVKTEPSFSLYGYQPFQHTFITHRELKAQQQEGARTPTSHNNSGSIPAGTPIHNKQPHHGSTPPNLVYQQQQQDMKEGLVDRSSTPSSRTSTPIGRPPSLSPKHPVRVPSAPNSQDGGYSSASNVSSNPKDRYDYFQPAPAHQSSSSRGSVTYQPQALDQPQNLVKSEPKQASSPRQLPPQQYGSPKGAPVTSSPSPMLPGGQPGSYHSSSNKTPVTTAYSYALIQQGLVPNPLYTPGHSPPSHPHHPHQHQAPQHHPQPQSHHHQQQHQPHHPKQPQLVHPQAKQAAAAPGIMSGMPLNRAPNSMVYSADSSSKGRAFSPVVASSKHMEYQNRTPPTLPPPQHRGSPGPLVYGGPSVPPNADSPRLVTGQITPSKTSPPPASSATVPGGRPSPLLGVQMQPLNLQSCNSNVTQVKRKPLTSSVVGSKDTPVASPTVPRKRPKPDDDLSMPPQLQPQVPAPVPTPERTVPTPHSANPVTSSPPASKGPPAVPTTTSAGTNSMDFLGTFRTFLSSTQQTQNSEYAYGKIAKSKQKLSKTDDVKSEPSSASSVSTASTNHTKLKKAWLQRHSETEDKKTSDDAVVPVAVIKTEPVDKDPPVLPASTQNNTTPSKASVAGKEAVRASSKASSNPATPPSAPETKEIKEEPDDSTTSASETEQELKKRPSRGSRKRAAPSSTGSGKKSKAPASVASEESTQDTPTKKEDSGGGKSQRKSPAPAAESSSSKGEQGNRGRGRRGRPKETKGGRSTATAAAAAAASEAENTASNTPAKKKTPSKPFEKPSVAVLKRTGDPFLQDGPCCDVAPKLPKCRECRMTPHQRSKKLPNIFCRFYAFRKLKYSKNGTIMSAGFSEPSDAMGTDLKLWLPPVDTPSKDLDTETSKFLLAHVGDQFCDLVEQEREARALHLGQDKTVTWKRVVQGVREMCDVCETTLFNIHWVCHKCGFVVCIDCYKARKNGTVKEEDQPPKDRDEFQWLLCTSRQPHEQEKLMLTQIIAGNALWDVGQLLHEVRRRWTIPTYCVCTRDSKDEKDSNHKKGNGLCKQLMSAVTKTFLNSNTSAEGLNGDSSRLTRKGGGNNGAGKAVLNGLSSLMKQEEGLGSFSSESGGSPLSWLADVALGSSQKISDKGESKENDSEGGDSPDRMWDDDKEEENFSTLRELLIRPTGKGGSNNNNNSSSGKSQSGQRKVLTSTLDEVISCVIEQRVGKVEKREEKELVHFTRRYPSAYRGREPMPIRICCLAESRLLYPNVPHDWLCNGRLLLLLDPANNDNITLFQEQWKRGQPVVVAEVNKYLDMSLWHPDGFCRDFGDVKNDLVNCKTGTVLPNQPMRKFWEGFENFSKRMKDDDGDYMLLKLKDWPPGEDFSELLPSRFKDLMKILPLHQYTHRNGVFNLAGRLPDCFVRPDLGPKMYNAYGSALYPTKGTTNLHLDISDAVNVMVYVGIPKDGKDEEHIQEALRAIDEGGCDTLMRERVREKGVKPGALWHIYNARDADKIRDLLNKVAVEQGETLEPHHDPIHDQSWYLNVELRERLSNEYNVEGYAIAQCLGDSVFIPAGAPHQVRNLHSCVKVAEDFVSPENIAHCFSLTQEFRNLSDTHTNHEDKLQIKNIIYHAVRDAMALLQSTDPSDTK